MSLPPRYTPLLGLLFGLWFLTHGHDVSAQESKPATRIIALSPHLVEQLYSIGAGHLVVAATDHSNYPEEAKTLPSVGNAYQLNFEAILALKPDLIISWQGGQSSQNIAKLKKLGFRVETSHPTQLSDIAKELRFLGQLTGYKAQAEQLATKVEQRLAELTHRYSQKPKVVVFYEIWANPLTTVANEAWPQQLLTVCGALNPFVRALGQYPQVGLESVLLSQPELIIQPTSLNSPQESFNWSTWPQIPAVKARLFSTPDADKLHRSTARTLDGLESLCKDIDHAREFYHHKNPPTP